MSDFVDVGISRDIPGGYSAGQIARITVAPAPSLADIGGLKEELFRLRETLELPLKHGEALKRAGIAPARLVIVHGPPGAGKTTLIKAFAADAGIRLFPVKWQQLVARSDEDSRRLLADTMARARANMPSLVVIDDLEQAGSGCGPVTDLVRKKAAQVAEAIDTLGRDEPVMAVAVTTCLEVIDPAMRKAGSLYEEVEVRLPSLEDRESILEVQTRGLALEGVDLASMAASTDGYSGAALTLLVRTAFYNALRRTAVSGYSSRIEQAVLTEQDFKVAMRALKQ